MVWGCKYNHEWGAITCEVVTSSSAGISTSGIDDSGLRQGVSIKTDKHRYGGVLFRLNSGLKDNKQSSPITHEVEQTTFGQPPTLESEGSPYSDGDKFDPVFYLKVDHFNDQIQFKSSTPELENYGAIEPLILREAIKFESIDTPYFKNDIHGGLQDGNEDSLLRNDRVIQFVPIKDATEQVPYVDAVGHIGDGTKGGVNVPGIISTQVKKIIPFDDARPETLFSGAPDSDKLTNVTAVDIALRAMTGSKDNDFRPKGYNSSAAGFVYRNNVEGTDSIAFGGLKR